MIVRSIESLDLDRAWQRLLFRKRRFIDIPDRLPFEIVDRVMSGHPRLNADHHLRRVRTVMATKGGGTVRPFARLSPLDELLYQALVDALGADIERSLPPHDTVFSYRLSGVGQDDPFEGSPRWDDFMRAVRESLESGRYSHALTADVSSYFVHIDVDELERRLLSACNNSDAVRDLGDLLRRWQQLGVHGLPQGVPASSPLGSFYLAPVDRELLASGCEHRRYMDDVWLFVESFSAARRAQDQLERLLYADGLGLGTDKLKVRRVATAIEATQTAAERIATRRAAIAEDVLAQADGDYVDVDEIELPEDEINEAAVHEEYDQLAQELREDRYPADVRARLTEVFRSLEKGRDTYAASEVPSLLQRLPDLTWPASRYISSLKNEDAAVAEEAFIDLLASDRFHREQEWLHLCRAGLALRSRPAQAVADRFAQIAASHPSDLVKVRALLAWGRLSATHEFAPADQFWAATSREWHAYVVVAIQGKDVTERDARYERWSGEGRFLRTLTTSIQASLLSWKDV